MPRRASNSTRPASSTPVLNITAGSIFFLPPRAQLGADFSGNDSDVDEGKYGHMVLVLENNDQRKRTVQVLGITSKYPPNDPRMLNLYVRLRWNPSETIDPNTDFIEVNVMRGDPFDSVSYINLRAYSIKKKILVELRRGRAAAKVERVELDKVLRKIRALSRTSNGQSLGITVIESTANSQLHSHTTLPSSRPVQPTPPTPPAPRTPATFTIPQPRAATTGSTRASLLGSDIQNTTSNPWAGPSSSRSGAQPVRNMYNSYGTYSTVNTPPTRQPLSYTPRASSYSSRTTPDQRGYYQAPNLEDGMRVYPTAGSDNHVYPTPPPRRDGSSFVEKCLWVTIGIVWCGIVYLAISGSLPS